MEESPAVDVKSLHAALDHAREEKGLSWRQLAKELDVSASTLSRMVNGLKPDVSAFAAMTTWLKMPADSFFRMSPSTDEEPELVVQLAPLLRARRDLDDKDVEYLEELIGGAVRRFRADRLKD
ncbi:helix-turn-helix domain-containing protein [Arthrobacter bambusae]|uniref:helix-turn-helix domain-containing protein n=1 Tax=Arthrobacter bambusae TaxID=1338426 RepID=UPI002785D5D6|nr:helix-turn-helix domain-containing protein [Arthrobacter bambusae]MDQ0212209.1 transcriptional regulator with XRE-family HTH domain [Arthrobacter bambusae]MDQ0236572.1 transcriptional regulator with XRE-family HTH domain [Arthrobacter bambusae]